MGANVVAMRRTHTPDKVARQASEHVDPTVAEILDAGIRNPIPAHEFRSLLEKTLEKIRNDAVKRGDESTLAALQGGSDGLVERIMALRAEPAPKSGRSRADGSRSVARRSGRMLRRFDLAGRKFTFPKPALAGVSIASLLLAGVVFSFLATLHPTYRGEAVLKTISMVGLQSIRAAEKVSDAAEAAHVAADKVHAAAPHEARFTAVLEFAGRLRDLGPAVTGLTSAVTDLTAIVNGLADLEEPSPTVSDAVAEAVDELVVAVDEVVIAAEEGVVIAAEEGVVIAAVQDLSIAVDDVLADAVEELAIAAHEARAGDIRAAVDGFAESVADLVIADERRRS